MIKLFKVIGISFVISIVGMITVKAQVWETPHIYKIGTEERYIKLDFGAEERIEMPGGPPGGDDGGYDETVIVDDCEKHTFNNIIDGMYYSAFKFNMRIKAPAFGPRELGEDLCFYVKRGSRTCGNEGKIGNMYFNVDDKTRLFISGANGRVGINTTDPQQQFHVVNGNILISRTPGVGNVGMMLFGANVTNTDPWGEWGIEYLNTPQDGYGLNFGKCWTSTQQGFNYALFLQDGTGNVGIGTKNPTAKLDVIGTIRAHEVKVCLNQGCDYVFAKDYKLMSLSDLSKFIETNKHLPDVAPAAEMEANGINVSEMSALFLRKIEELTLYIIALEKQVKELQQKVNEKGGEQ